MPRNIPLAYLLTICKHSWFWLGIWVFYYLRFTDYAGIGLIETTLIASMTIAEIPSGAIADILGKKLTLFISFLLQASGGVIMAATTSFAGLALSVLIMGLGGTFYSGTLEALIYDTLKVKKSEKKYDAIIANISSLQLAIPAISGALGGFLYVVNSRLPFWLNASFYALGLLLTFFLTEPKIDTEKFSWSVYRQQTIQGWRQLTKTTFIKQQTILLLSIGVILVIMDEMLNSFLGLEFGFSEKMIGVIWGIIFVLASIASQLTPWIKKMWGTDHALFVVGGLIAVSLMISPWLGVFTGAMTLFFRYSLQSIHGNLSSIAINEHTESKYRATTLSTFNTLKNVPYLIAASFLGVLADIFTARIIALGLGVFLICLLSWRRIRV